MLYSQMKRPPHTLGLYCVKIFLNYKVNIDINFSEIIHTHKKLEKKRKNAMWKENKIKTSL